MENSGIPLAEYILSALLLSDFHSWSWTTLRKGTAVHCTGKLGLGCTVHRCNAKKAVRLPKVSISLRTEVVRLLKEVGRLSEVTFMPEVTVRLPEMAVRLSEEV